MAIAYLCLGSNVGDKLSYVQQAVKLLTESSMVTVVRSSAFYETEPWGNKKLDWFVNAVIEIKTSLTAQELLDLCNKTEAFLGRTRDLKNGYQDRTIDIDILFFGKEVIETSTLTIPHKFVHLRAFNLVPMLELNPNYVHPVLQKNILELHENLENPEMVVLYGTR